MWIMGEFETVIPPVAIPFPVRVRGVITSSSPVLYHLEAAFPIEVLTDDAEEAFTTQLDKYIHQYEVENAAFVDDNGKPLNDDSP